MNELDFNEELRKVAKDLVGQWDPRTKKWGVYQKTSYLLTSSPQRPWLMFNIEDDEGNPRLPDKRDIGRAARSVYAGHTLFKVGADEYVNRIEQNEADKKATRASQNDERVSWAAKEIIKADRSTHHRMWR